MKIHTVLFDLDGTLIDPQIGITESARYAMAEMARPLPLNTDLNWFIGPPIQANFAQMLNTQDQVLIDTAVRHYRSRFGTVGLFEATVYEGVPAMLSRLQSHKYRLLLATSKPHLYALQILAHFDLARYFDGVYGSQMDGRLANKTALIRHILTSEQLNPAQTAMVGDREHDVLGANANGIIGIGVTYGYGRADDLLTAGASWLVHAPSELFNTIQSVTNQKE